MKVKKFLLALFSILLITKGLSQTQVVASNDIEWKPVLINMDGTNAFKGIDVTYMVSKCNSKDVVLLKLVNTNTYSVKAQWINVVVTKGGELFGNSKLVSLKLAPSSENIGYCSGKIIQLTIKLSDFGIDATNIDTFVASNFDVFITK